jgi:uncharacterized protein (TIGR02145 family)
MKNFPALFLAFIIVLLSLPADAQVDANVLQDERDGRQYRVVTIGNQVWMAENLNYGEQLKSCYDNDPSNCERYGGLYTWEVALEVCPDGWHLPTIEDWNALSDFLGKEDAGQKIKASTEDPVPWDGTNESGFTALAAGSGNGEGFHREGDWALFWSASEYNDQRAWFAQLDGFWYRQPPKYKNIYTGWYYLKTNEFSVRCIQDHK